MDELTRRALVDIVENTIADYDARELSDTDLEGLNREDLSCISECLQFGQVSERLGNITRFLIERKSVYQKKANNAYKQEQTAKHLLQDEPDREDVKDDLIQCIKLQDRYNALIEFIEELQKKISP